MLQFQFEKGCDRTKRYRKMKRMQRAHLDLMGMKLDTAQRRDDVGQRRYGTEEEKWRRQRSWANTNFTRPKNKEKPCGRFSCYKWTVKI
jgi:hypothetical protein